MIVSAPKEGRGKAAARCWKWWTWLAAQRFQGLEQRLADDQLVELRGTLLRGDKRVIRFDEFLEVADLRRHRLGGQLLHDGVDFLEDAGGVGVLGLGDFRREDLELLEGFLS